MNKESFEKLHGFFIEDLKVGQKAILKKELLMDFCQQA